MKIRSRIFLVFLLTLGGGYYLLIDWVGDNLRFRYNESFEEPLVDTANILAELFARDVALEGAVEPATRDAFMRSYARRFEAQIYDLSKQQVDMRIYVTDRNGTVLFDSAGGRDEGRNYSQWNDVARTLRGEYGARSTKGDPFYADGSVVYVAAPILVDNQIVGVVSVGKPKRSIYLFLAAARSNLITVAVVAGILAALVGFMLYRWVSRPLQQLVEYAQRVNSGVRVEAPDLGDNEVGEVATAMESMRRTLEGKEGIERYIETLTHELKSPLSAIRGAAELLLEDMPAAKRRHFSRNILQETGRLQDIADRLLQLAALEKRNRLENIENIDVCALVDDVIAGLDAIASANRISVDNRVRPDTVVPGERFLIRQALSNLVSNALDFSPEAGVVAVRATTENGNLDLWVDDQGPGVPEYATGRIFERFYSLPRPGTQRKSTGLGLSFVKEVAELHGGEVAFEQREGGVAFCLSLPLADQ